MLLLSFCDDRRIQANSLSRCFPPNRSFTLSLSPTLEHERYRSLLILPALCLEECVLAWAALKVGWSRTELLPVGRFDLEVTMAMFAATVAQSFGMICIDGRRYRLDYVLSFNPQKRNLRIRTDSLPHLSFPIFRDMGTVLLVPPKRDTCLGTGAFGV